MRQSCLVCCDISDDKRLRKVFKTMRGCGDRVITALGQPCVSLDAPCFIV